MIRSHVLTATLGSLSARATACVAAGKSARFPSESLTPSLARSMSSLRTSASSVRSARRPGSSTITAIAARKRAQALAAEKQHPPLDAHTHPTGPDAPHYFTMPAPAASLPPHSAPPGEVTSLPAVPASGPDAVLSPVDPAADLFRGPQLGIVRKLEMMNLLVGFEQANQYAIHNHLGQQVGYIVEEDSFGSSLLRNFLHTHRRMNAWVLNARGEPVLHVHRPFNWINSTITISTPDGREIGAVEQEWHLWRRRYNLFNAREQFARIDAPFLAWEFAMCDEAGVPVGIVDRNFTGLGRELFTDTGHYAVHFVPPADARAKAVQAGVKVDELKLDERAVALAAAVSIDFDYFSRDRRGIMPAGIWLPGIWSSED